MKKQFFYIFIFLLVGTTLTCCQTELLTDRSEETKTFSIDFRKYNEKGFLFMPDEYFGEYQVLGIIRAELHPQVRYLDGTIPEGEGYSVHHFFAGDKRVSQIVEGVNMDDLIEHIYNLATEWGGDAFSHFESSIKTDRTDDNINTSYAYYSISGIVIKRE